VKMEVFEEIQIGRFEILLSGTLKIGSTFEQVWESGWERW